MQYVKAICLLLLLSNACMAEIYRWVDESGKVHYTDQPPEVAEKVTLKEATINSHDHSDRARMEKNRQWFEAQRKKRAEAEEKKQADKKAQYQANSGKRESCRRAKQQLARYREELKNRKRAGVKVSVESWYKTKIETLEFDVKQKC